MSYNHFYKQIDQTARSLFPGLKEIPEITWDHLISPLEVKLPKSVLTYAQEGIRALHRVSRRPEYERKLEPVPGISEAAARHESLLMAYDFHTTEDGRCFLVEVNTNAAGFLFSSVMEMVHKQAPVVQFEPLNRLGDAFRKELELSGVSHGGTPRVMISDEDIPNQKMYAEFLMYRDWLRGQGWDAELCEGKDFQFEEGRLRTLYGRPVDLVYNRLTDFYFEEPHYAALKQAFSSQTACISPNPKEYWRLADKQRLVQWSQPEFLKTAGASDDEIRAIEAILIPTYDRGHYGSDDEIWAERKHLFFKPKRSYGGKSVYRGESVSRKVFERLMQDDILIQRYQPPQRMPTDDPRSVLSNWKFDVRFYVYADRIQLVAARIYQGQVTNFASPMGGFTMVGFR